MAKLINLFSMKMENARISQHLLKNKILSEKNSDSEKSYFIAELTTFTRGRNTTYYFFTLLVAI